MRSSCASRLTSLTASLEVAFLLAAPALAVDCPELVGSLPGGGCTTDIAVSGGYAYVMDSCDLTLRVIDVSDPSAPVEVVSIEHRYWPTAVAVSEGYAYTADFGASPYGGGDHMTVFDVSTPSAPVWIGQYYDSGGRYPSYDVAISGRFVYVANGSWGGHPGLEVISVTWPWMPFEVGFLDTPAELRGVTVEDGFAYVAGSDGLRVIDVTTPALPFEVGFLDTPDEANGVAVEDGYAYLAGSDGLRVIDVNLPWGPFEVGFLGTPMPAFQVAVSRGYAYVACGSPGQLRVIDVSTPSAPVEVGFYETGGEFRWYYDGGIAVSDGYVFVGNDGVPLNVFRECPLFTDGFESGDTSAWSATVP